VVTYRCEWCKREKKAGQRWILALAAERVTRTVRRREIKVLRQWHSAWAQHPLAVHLCCRDHLDRYVQVMFAIAPQRVAKRSSARPVVQLETQLAPGPAQRYEAAIERRHRDPRNASAPRARKRALSFTELDLIRAHGMGIAL
jgi:hypothetical protein